jgi:hypothetical protein
VQNETAVVCIEGERHDLQSGDTVVIEAAEGLAARARLVHRHLSMRTLCSNRFPPSL